jgi:hypothetical protein
VSFEVLVNIAVIAVFIFELLDIFSRGFGGAFALLLDNCVKRGVNIFGHASCITANVKTRPVLEPAEEFR